MCDKFIITSVYINLFFTNTSDDFKEVVEQFSDYSFDDEEGKDDEDDEDIEAMDSGS